MVIYNVNDVMYAYFKLFSFSEIILYWNEVQDFLVRKLLLNIGHLGVKFKYSCSFDGMCSYFVGLIT